MSSLDAWAVADSNIGVHYHSSNSAYSQSDSTNKLLREVIDDILSGLTDNELSRLMLFLAGKRSERGHRESWGHVRNEWDRRQSSE